MTAPAKPFTPHGDTTRNSDSSQDGDRTARGAVADGIDEMSREEAGYWLGMAIPAQAGVVSAFIPTSTNLNSPQPPGATAAQQAAGVAQLISRLTLGAVKVTIPGPAVVPLA
jgi:hypothetical protein